MTEFKQQFKIGDNVNIPFGTKVTVLLGDLFQGIVVGKCQNEYIIKCTDGTYPNDFYPYDTWVISLPLIMINTEQTE